MASGGRTAIANGGNAIPSPVRNPKKEEGPCAASVPADVRCSGTASRTVQAICRRQGLKSLVAFPTIQSSNGIAEAYVLDADSKKTHHPDCPSVTKMSPKNREDVNTPLDKLLAQGCTTCGNCF